MKKIAIIITLFLVSNSANAVYVSTDFTLDMYDPNGTLISTTTSPYGFVDQEAGTWGTYDPWFTLDWSTHDGTLYTEGSYSIDTIQGAPMSFAVGAGQIGGHILLNWGATVDIDVVNVWDINADGSLSYATVPGMTDGPFVGFQASFELTGPGLVSTVPVPAAVWLFGSGLLGLVGVARRKAASLIFS